MTYEIKRHDTGETKQYTTDAKGEIALKEIPAFYEKDGKYVQNKLDVKEVKAPAGYILDKQTHTITIEPNKEVTLTAKMTYNSSFQKERKSKKSIMRKNPGIKANLFMIPFLQKISNLILSPKQILLRQIKKQSL